MRRRISQLAYSLAHYDQHVPQSLLKKLIMLNLNNVLCYFPRNVVLQGHLHVPSSYIEVDKVERRSGQIEFLEMAFRRFHVATWSYIQLEDDLELLPLFMLRKFIKTNSFSFVASRNLSMKEVLFVCFVLFCLYF